MKRAKPLKSWLGLVLRRGVVSGEKKGSVNECVDGANSAGVHRRKGSEMKNESFAAITAEPVVRKRRARVGKAERGIFEKQAGSDIWWIRYVDAQGRYRREKAGTWGNADKLLTKRKHEALRGKKLPEPLRQRTVHFSEIGEDALAYSRAHKRSYRDDESRMKRLKEWFGSREAESLTGPEMEKRLSEVAAAERWAASTYNHYRSLLMLVYREARRAGKVSGSPARDIRHRKETNSRVRFLSRGANGEYERLTKAIRGKYPEHLPEFIFALNTGLRLSSQYGATYGMIDWTRNVLDLPRTKNDEPIHVPLNDTVLQTLRSLPSWQERKGPIFRNQRRPEEPVLSNDHWFKPALKAAGIRDFRWHDIRHTFASWLVQDGVPLDRLSKLLGHKSLTMTMRYAHLAPNQLHEDVALLTRNSTPVAPADGAQATVSATFVN
jgi:integrase